MPIPPYPYRHLSFARPRSPPADAIGRASVAARRFVLLWSVLRDLTSLAHGLDFESFLAAAIVALTLVVHAKGPLP
jgi:hypothetical protein